jgi:hypothetical protein
MPQQMPGAVPGAAPMSAAPQPATNDINTIFKSELSK